ncbi:hypothetical protein KSF78_0000565 [Schistosoma japonicum]|nr:hypothetical protein KSF78_0000565 [Schistosoma japonicum]
MKSTTGKFSSEKLSFICFWLL